MAEQKGGKKRTKAERKKDTDERNERKKAERKKDTDERNEREKAHQRERDARISSLENDLKERNEEIKRLLAEKSVLSQRFDLRYNCEALFGSGRVEEAAREFLRLLETFGTNNVMPEWAIDLQKRCVDNLVALADQALTSESHARAIALYSSALSLKPAAPVDILVKRSELCASQGLWSEALADADEVIRLDPLLPQGYERKFIALRGLRGHDLKDIHATCTVRKIG